MASSPRTTSTRLHRARTIALILIAALLAIATLLVSRYVLYTIANSDAAGGSPRPTMGGDSSLDTTVVRVVDGDTLVARAEGRVERIRLIGIDTPETVSPSKPVQCYGKQASDHLKALLPPGTAVTLITDADTHDVYGRLLAYVYRHPDGLFVNLELAQDGYASLLTFPPNVAHEPQFSRAVDAAHQRRLGLWGTCGGPGVPLADAPSTTGRVRGSGG